MSSYLMRYFVLHDLHGDLSDVILFCGVFCRDLMNCEFMFRLSTNIFESSLISYMHDFISLQVSSSYWLGLAN